MYDGNDITGGEDELVTIIQKGDHRRCVMWTHAFREAELVSLNVVEGTTAVPLAD